MGSLTLNIAHRGASGSKPENTLAAFTHALEAGADGIELDVRACKSGELVVIHDATLTRTLEGKGRVIQKTLAELQAMPAKGGGQVLTLEEVFKAIGTKAYCFVELKDGARAADTAQLIRDYCSRGWRADRLILITFDHKALIVARKAFADIAIGVSVKKLTAAAIRKAVKMEADYILPHFSHAPAALIASAQEAGLKVVVWTVNGPKDIHAMVKAGVDGIMGDYPERLLDLEG